MNHRLPIYYYCAGIITFLTFAMFQYDYWTTLYYVWDKGKDVILFYLCWELTVKKHGNEYQPVFYLALTRLLWEIVSAFTGWHVNNPVAVGGMFIIFSAYVFFKAIHNARN